jgi:dienelactone hydrolase
MNQSGKTLVTIALMLPIVLVPPAVGAQSELVREELSIPAASNKPPGMLTALAIRPPGAGPFPLALINHGNGSPTNQASLKVDRFVGVAEAFARRGYAAVIVLRRGAGSTPGPYFEHMGTCDGADHTSGLAATVNDMSDALRHLQTLVWIDGDRVVAVGTSAGGMGVLALGASSPPGLRAVINFAGGRGVFFNVRGQRTHICGEREVIRLFTEFGERSRVPSLWLYSENDGWVLPENGRQFHTVYVRGGAPTQFTLVGPSGKEGHYYMMQSIADWLPRVFAFLRDLGLPG